MRSERGKADTEAIALRSPTLCRFFSAVMRRQMRRHFNAVRVSTAALPSLPEDRAVIVYSNHPSWWDPAFFIVLSAALFPARKGYGPMDAASLARYGFMRRIGVFGVAQDTRRGAADFLRTSRAVLADPASVLWITAEGAFTDPRRRPVRLRPGTAHLLTHLEDVVALPLALEYPFWSERLPEALCRFGAPLYVGECHSVADWQTRLEERLSATMDLLAADALTRDASRFEIILQGEPGVGGIYDLFRGVRAAARRERFVAEHGTRST